ncbi:hypothetical protein MGWOODY_Smn381 [hydrothermal vent metagenome]|uniref:Uncharacterized protein n=1 Tax=hydrothermal vent metagenome TaxID=652676 RepID=A0A160TFC0_9ZZZZ
MLDAFGNPCEGLRRIRVRLEDILARLLAHQGTADRLVELVADARSHQHAGIDRTDPETPLPAGRDQNGGAERCQIQRIERWYDNTEVGFRFQFPRSSPERPPHRGNPDPVRLPLPFGNHHWCRAIYFRCMRGTALGKLCPVLAVSG